MTLEDVTVGNGVVVATICCGCQKRTALRDSWRGSSEPNSIPSLIQSVSLAAESLLVIKIQIGSIDMHNPLQTWLGMDLCICNEWPCDVPACSNK